jgi:hypothetical protein
MVEGGRNLLRAVGVNLIAIEVTDNNTMDDGRVAEKGVSLDVENQPRAGARSVGRWDDEA